MAGTYGATGGEALLQNGRNASGLGRDENRQRFARADYTSNADDRIGNGGIAPAVSALHRSAPSRESQSEAVRSGAALQIVEKGSELAVPTATRSVGYR